MTLKNCIFRAFLIGFEDPGPEKSCFLTVIYPRNMFPGQFLHLEKNSIFPFAQKPHRIFLPPLTLHENLQNFVFTLKLTKITQIQNGFFQSYVIKSLVSEYAKIF